MPQFFNTFWAATSFLTRLLPGRIFTNAEMKNSPAWYPLTGLLLGLLTTALTAGLAMCLNALETALAALPQFIPVKAGEFCATSYAVAGVSPYLSGFLYMLLNFWLTRGLHHDALSDISDAWGSSATGEKFQKILKDSRIGAFGVCGLFFVLSLQLIAAGILFSRGSFAVLIFAPFVGRTALLFLPACCAPAPFSTLGKLLDHPSARKRFGFWAAATLLAGLFIAPRAACLALPLFLLWAYGLRSLARREGGYNGDFVGALCILTESSVLLGGAL